MRLRIKSIRLKIFLLKKIKFQIFPPATSAGDLFWPLYCECIGESKYKINRLFVTIIAKLYRLFITINCEINRLFVTRNTKIYRLFVTKIIALYRLYITIIAKLYRLFITIFL